MAPDPIMKRPRGTRVQIVSRAANVAPGPPKDRWASDVIVDLLHAYDLPYAALNPGASFRGLHDSIVNYGGNRPTMMLCQHEETAVQIAHGYAKASGKPMVAILHNLVGLLHSNMAIYYAYIDRAPVFVVGATGPMDETKRRPRIDWIHTAQGQGEAVRAYTKWDYQPHTIDGVPEAFSRAYSVMMTQPQGPVYMCYDAWMQEQQLDHEVAMPPAGAARVPTRMAPEPRALAEAAGLIAAAAKPVIIAEYVGREPGGLPCARGARRDGRHPGLRRRQPLELPDAAPAEHEPLEGRVPRRGPRSVSRHAGLGAADDGAREHDAATHIDRTGERDVDRHRLRRPGTFELGARLPAPASRAASDPRRHDDRDPGGHPAPRGPDREGRETARPDQGAHG